MSDTPEFSRPVRVDTLGQPPHSLEIEADADEREALARRFGLVGIDRLHAQAEVVRRKGAVIAEGRLCAAVTQSCVATGDPVAEAIEEDFRLEFRPHPEVARSDEEIELGAGELDVIFYDGAMVDVGEAVAETMHLALDPYPRSPRAEAALKEAGVRSEKEAKAESSPFAALKDKLGK